MLDVITLKGESGIQVQPLPEFRVLSEEELDQVAGGVIPLIVGAFSAGLVVGSLVAIWQISNQR